MSSTVSPTPSPGTNPSTTSTTGSTTSSLTGSTTGASSPGGSVVVGMGPGPTMVVGGVVGVVVGCSAASWCPWWALADRPGRRVVAGRRGGDAVRRRRATRVLDALGARRCAHGDLGGRHGRGRVLGDHRRTREPADHQRGRREGSGRADRGGEQHRSDDRDLRKGGRGSHDPAQLADGHGHERPHDRVVELGSGAAHELGAGGLRGERILVGASRRHHVERIGHRDDARGQADLRCPAGPWGSRHRPIARGARRPRAPTHRATARATG